MSITEIKKEIEKLEQEIKEKKQRLAELKHSLSQKRVKNYQFTDFYGKPVTLSELFGDKNELVVIQNMGKSCAYCTMWADGFNGIYHHIARKSAFVVATPDAPEVQRAFRAERKWQFPMVSTMNSTFKEDLGFIKDGSQYPGVSSFRKDENGNIYHVTDAFFGPWDDFCPVYPLLDLLPSGSKAFIPEKKINEKGPFHLTNRLTIHVQPLKEAIHFYEQALGMTIEHVSNNEARLSISGYPIYVKETESDLGMICLEFAVDDYERKKDQLLKKGCRIVQEFNAKHALLEDPFGVYFYLFESVN